MSLGGCYVAIKQEQLDDILKNNKSLSDVVFDENLNLNTYSLEQSWDAIRVLLKEIAPNVVGARELKEVDLGEMCFCLTQSELVNVSKQINTLTKEKIVELFNSSDFQEEDFYWENLWKDEESIEELIEFIFGLQKFLEQSIKKQEMLLFYLT